MSKTIDLQIHSAYSDGNLNPSQIINRAKKENLAVISLTDHNVIDGVAEAIKAGKQKKVVVIPGVEIYTEFEGKKLHLLGYNFDLENINLNNFLLKSQIHHYQWARKSLQKMAELNFKINFDKLQKLPSKYCGFKHLKDIIMADRTNRERIKKEIKPQFNEPTLFEFINFYFADGKIAFVPDEHLKIPTPDAIAIIRDAGGLPVLAHPGQQLSWNDDHLISELKNHGLRGLEVLSPYHTWHQTEHYQKLANNLDLAITGGSDFHGDLIDRTLKNQFIKNAWDYFRVPYAIYENLKKYLK